jgi:adenine-specific DNA-methyltransferase
MSEHTGFVFGLSWTGKSEAAALADSPAVCQLHPDGVVTPDADHTFIEGDNLDALKLLMPQYEGQVKLIFIDPPYNTGSDRFIYKDDFSDGTHRHAAWCSMMLPRLILARRMLREDGVIFISIGDDELQHLWLLMNEVFGEEAFVANLLWRRRKTQANLSRLVAPVHDYVLCFAKDKAKLRFNKIGYSDAFVRKTFANPDNDPRGPYQTRPLAQPANASNREYTLTLPTGRAITARWSCSPETFAGYLSEGRLHIPRNGHGMPRLKIFLRDLEGAIPNTWLDDAGTYEEGSKEIERIFGSNAFFISPKPTALIRRLITMGAGANDIIMDFFAGSGTTAHAVALMNKADGGRRKSISIQQPEPTEPGSLPHQQGYHTISHICRERITRVLAGMAEDGVAGEMPTVALNAFSLQG